MTNKQKNENGKDSFNRFEIRLSGSGGQGLVVGGVMLAEALATVDGKNVVQTQSYGPEAPMLRFTIPSRWESTCCWQ